MHNKTECFYSLKSPKTIRDRNNMLRGRKKKKSTWHFLIHLELSHTYLY